MGTADIRAYYGADRRGTSGWNRDIQTFVTLAAQTRFEMRYLGEDRWHPAPTEDVAQTLIAYHPDLEQCMQRLLDGEELASRLALFRVATHPSRLPYR